MFIGPDQQTCRGFFFLFFTYQSVLTYVLGTQRTTCVVGTQKNRLKEQFL